MKSASPCDGLQGGRGRIASRPQRSDVPFNERRARDRSQPDGAEAAHVDCFWFGSVLREVSLALAQPLKWIAAAAAVA